MQLLLKVLVLLRVATASKVYDRCDLAKELLEEHELPKHQIATWVCIARHESEFNTSAYNPSSGDHGLFQISELWWCSTDGSNGGACGLPCSSFRDNNIADDVVCARRIFREHKRLSGDGFNAWVVYPLYCKNNVDKYIENCFTDKPIVKSNYSTNIESTTLEYDTSTLNYRPKSRYFSNLAPTTADIQKNYISRSNIQYSKITTQKPQIKAQELKNNIFSREIRKIHRFIEHPTGHRYKYHINKSGFSIFKEN